MATTDELTGLANRERFRVRLDEQIDRCLKGSTTFAAMLIDLLIAWIVLMPSNPPSTFIIRGQSEVSKNF